MKKATTKILLAALSLIMAIGIATGSTFAWFVSNRTVTVGAIDATVTTGTQGLYVAVKKADATYTAFNTALTGPNINTAILGTGGSVVLDALTTSNSGVALQNRAGTAAAAFNSTGENAYLEFTLKFRTTVAQDIYLGYTTTTSQEQADINAALAASSRIYPTATAYSGTAVKAWKAIDANEYGTHSAIAKNAAIEARAAHAARVAFITGQTGVVWAPYDYAAGNNDGYNVQAGYFTGNLASDYEHNVIGTEEYSTQNKNAVKLENDADAKAGTVTSGATKIVSTTDNSEGAFDAEVTIRIWIEGTDGDCFNSIFGDQLSVNLVFTSVPTPANP